MKRGFASLILTTLILLFLLQQQSLNTSRRAALEQLSLELEAEQLSIQRTILDNTTSRIIAETLKKNAAANAAMPEVLHERIAIALSTYYQHLEENTNGIQFFEAKVNPENYAAILAQPLDSFSVKSIQENSNTSIIQSNKVTKATFTLTGGALQNRTVIAVLKMPHYTDYFLLPLQYTQTVIVIQ